MWEQFPPARTDADNLVNNILQDNQSERKMSAY